MFCQFAQYRVQRTTETMRKPSCTPPIKRDLLILESQYEEIFGKNGGAYRDRTDDLNAASVALSQLS